MTARRTHNALVPLSLAFVMSLSSCGSETVGDPSDEPAARELTDEQAALVTGAGERYAEYVRAETDKLLAGTAAFVAAYKAGKDELARHLYAPTRMHWESIEPVAESFGDLDPKTDAREADLEEGEVWTGWHLLEKDLWPAEAGSDYRPLSDEDRAKYADLLLSDLQILDSEVDELTFTGQQIANGSKELLDEVANGKITGEEEFWSHTDLYDFQANVDGAEEAFEVLKPVVEQTDPELAGTLLSRFDELQVLLDEQRQGKGFVDYSTVAEDVRKKLSDAVNALAEPLSQLATAVE